MTGISNKLRKEALLLSHKCNDGNLQSVFSCLEIIWTLYDRIMNWTPEISNEDIRDYFIISKGQATLALYPVLIEKGMFSFDEIYNEIGLFESRYCIQTDCTKFDGGIENSAGSLGHGLPFAVGIAFANKLKKNDSKVFVLCGDGEFCEGTMWEACIFAASNKLNNLCIIIDDNNSAQAMVKMSNLGQRLKSFGFVVRDVDGHNMFEIEKALKDITVSEFPQILVAHTIRGYGSKTMIENDVWFHRAPNELELNQLLKEVDEF